MDFKDLIPGLTEATDRERLIRNASFIVDSELIGPFHVRLMTLRDYLLLDLHPLLNNQIPTVGELVIFIRFLWTGHRWKPRIRDLIARWLFSRRCLKYVDWYYEETLASALTYLEETLTDAVGAKSMGWNPSFYSEAVSYIGPICRLYPWATPDKVLDTPMKILLQYKRELEHAAGIQPSNRSDQLIAQQTLAMRRN